MKGGCFVAANPVMTEMKDDCKHGCGSPHTIRPYISPPLRQSSADEPEHILIENLLRPLEIHRHTRSLSRIGISTQPDFRQTKRLKHQAAASGSHHLILPAVGIQRLQQRIGPAGQPARRIHHPPARNRSSEPAPSGPHPSKTATGHKLLLASIIPLPSATPECANHGQTKHHNSCPLYAHPNRPWHDPTPIWPGTGRYMRPHPAAACHDTNESIRI